MRVAPPSLDELTEACAAFEAPLAVLRMAGAALVDACPRALGGTYVVSDWPARRLVAVGCTTREGVHPELERAYAAAYPTTYLGYDRSRVQAEQRDRWFEPLRAHVDGRSFRASDGYRAVFEPSGTWHHGRRVYCRGPRAIAYASACLPADGPGFTPEEGARLERVAARLAPILQLLSASAGGDGSREALDHLLADRPDPCFLLGRGGVLLGASPAGELALTRRPELLERARDLVRTSPARAVAAPIGNAELHVSPCSRRGASTAHLALVRPSGSSVHRHRLTTRQAELVEQLRTGRSNAEIAAQLGLSPATVKTLLERLYRRAGVRGRVELLRWVDE